MSSPLEYVAMGTMELAVLVLVLVCDVGVDLAGMRVLVGDDVLMEPLL